MSFNEALTQWLPADLPAEGIGEPETLERFRELMQGYSTDLAAPTAFAHMDPPPAEIAAELVGLNARYNQNLLHPDVSPFASAAEVFLLNWLAPEFGMKTGHLCAGSTLSNLTALWCAREHGATRVVASSEAHLSIEKSARILGLPLVTVDVDSAGRLLRSELPDLGEAALVLTAGTTARGVIDELSGHDALWTHVDAAWAGPLMLSRFADRLKGIEHADSVAISGHKWFYQPKDSALIMFAEVKATDCISTGGHYLTTANVGIQGSRSAAAIPLLATLVAWGRQGLARKLEHSMAASERLAHYIDDHPDLVLRQWPESGVLNWRAINVSASQLNARLGTACSLVVTDDEQWVRQVAANPHADVDQLVSLIDVALN